MRKAENRINRDVKLSYPKNERINTLKNPFIPEITRTIGQGDDAKNSIVYLVIKWAFFAGGFITSLCFINNWFFDKEKSFCVVDAIRIIWEIIMPIITLALGYAFGKSINK